MRLSSKTSQSHRLTLALAISCGIGLFACGGSSSETPWPAEPIDLEPGPAGEGRQGGNVLDTTKLPDNYSKRGQGGAATSDGESPADPEDPEVDPEDTPWGPEAPPEKKE